MGKTIRVSEEYHRFLKAHNRDDETMEETLKRLTGGPDPRAVAGILSEESAEEMREAVENLRERDDERLRRVRDTFGSDGA